MGEAERLARLICDAHGPRPDGWVVTSAGTVPMWENYMLPALAVMKDRAAALEQRDAEIARLKAELVEEMANNGAWAARLERAEEEIARLRAEAEAATRRERERCWRLVDRRRARASGKASLCFDRGNFGQMRVHEEAASQLSLASREIEDPEQEAAGIVIQAASERLEAEQRKRDLLQREAGYHAD